MTILLEELNAKGKCTLPIGMAAASAGERGKAALGGSKAMPCPGRLCLRCSWCLPSSGKHLSQPSPRWLKGPGGMDGFMGPQTPSFTRGGMSRADSRELQREQRFLCGLSAPHSPAR